MAHAGLSAGFTLSYNGYTFGGASKVKWTATPVRDDAGRTVIYTRYEINVEAVITPDDQEDCDSALNTIQRLLAEDGKSLVFTGAGGGTIINVNRASGGKRDVAWGPKPQVLKWESLGADQAALVNWTVIANVSVCETSTRWTGVMAFGYDISYDYDKGGYATKTITGYLQIAQTRTLDGTPADSADNYRSLIVPAAEFQTSSDITHKFSLSRDHSRLEFSITQSVHKSFNIYPEKVVSISGRHDVSWQRANKGAAILRNTLSLQIERGYRAGREIPWVVFLSIVKKRRQAAIDADKDTLLDSVDISEDLFGVMHSFRASWRTLDTTVGNIVEHSGLFAPLTTTTADEWRDSLKYERLEAPRTAGITGTNQDAIVDLCGNTTLPLMGYNSAPVDDQPKQPASPLTNYQPRKSTSYAQFRNVVIPSRKVPVERHAVLQTASTDYISGDAIGGERFAYNTTDRTKDTLQIQGTPQYSVRIVGQALRAGYEIPRPALPMFGNKPTTEVSGTFMCEVAGNYFGVAVYRAAWDISYIVDGCPGEVAPLDKPDEGVVGLQQSNGNGGSISNGKIDPFAGQGYNSY